MITEAGNVITHPIKSLFNKNKIRSIAIVDDSFDPPKREDIAEDIQSFWEMIDEDKKAIQELGFLGFDIGSVDDINNELIKNLWINRNKLKSLKKIFQGILLPAISEKQDRNVKYFCDFLDKELSMKFKCFGSDEEFRYEDFKLVFIDYYLGPIGTELQEKSAIAKSIRTTEKIIAAFKDKKEKPLIVLMSSRRVSEATRAHFRDESGLLEGMFYFIPKSDMPDKVKIALKLEAIAMTLPLRHNIQYFVDSLSKSLPKVADDFLISIKKLSLDDYVYIQKLSLQDDGHPLGDYLSWLYSSYFGHLLFEKNSDLNKWKKVIDKEVLSSLPPYQSKPSSLVAEIYRSALFAKVEDIDKHPHSTKKESNTYLQLGDLFIKDEKNDVLMVINAQCDLAFAPAGKSRPFKPSRSIMFIPGSLQLMTDVIIKVDEETAKTDLFDYKGKIYRIMWDPKNVLTKDYGLIKRWANKNGYVREFRLRLPYALEIQRAFASDLTRVGMPVAPPISIPVEATVYFKSSNKESGILLKSSDSDAFFVMTKDGVKCNLTEKFILELKEKLDDAISNQKAIIDSLDVIKDQKKKTKMAENVQKLMEFVSDSKGLMELWQPFPLPAEGKSKAMSSGVNITRGKPNISYDEVGKVLCINVDIRERK